MIYNVVLVLGVEQSGSHMYTYHIYTYHIYVYIYIYPFFFRFFSHLGYYRVLGRVRVPCAIRLSILYMVVCICYQRGTVGGRDKSGV